METKSELKIDHLSASQINLYQQCALKYRFQYVDGLPRPFRPSGLAFGSVIHSALDWFHKEKIRGGEVSLGTLLKMFEADWFSQKIEEEIQAEEFKGIKNEIEQDIKDITESTKPDFIDDIYKDSDKDDEGKKVT